MITLEEAFEIIEKEVTELEPASIPLLEALGCALREDIISRINVPRFANSAMDGFAVRLSDLTGLGPWRLPIQKIIAAGDSSGESLEEGYTAKIMTGAPLPDGADSVIRIEDVSIDVDRVIIESKPPKDNFIRPVADDIKKGELLYKKGVILDPIAIGILASIGRLDVKVAPKPKIAILSTGSELVTPGEELPRGKIYGSNDYVLRSLLKKDGHGISHSFKTSTDEFDELCKILEDIMRDCDLLISSGGVSMGDYDLIPQAVEKIGGEILFHKTYVKPGKPVLLARIRNRWLLGLPGNPVSVVVGYHLHARRIIARLSGLDYRPRKGKAILGADLSVKGSRFCVIGARIEETENGIIVFPSIRQQSGRLSSIKGINGFIFAEGGTRTVKKGMEVVIEWMDQAR
ncbi:MAG: molybdopterin molybdotransferase MoeA [Candidatus Zixiibacteriota bacterium]|nr:MAG: molybdopterin molybdotransferase MoeA [candidate division Zixibacteria bacterium]